MLKTKKRYNKKIKNYSNFNHKKNKTVKNNKYKKIKTVKNHKRKINKSNKRDKSDESNESNKGNKVNDHTLFKGHDDDDDDDEKLSLKIILKNYGKYKNNLKKTLDFINKKKIKKYRLKNDFYTYINYQWIQEQKRESKIKKKYYTQIDNYRITQEKVYYQLIDYTNNYIKANKGQKKTKLIEEVLYCLSQSKKEKGYESAQKVKQMLNEAYEKNDMYYLLAKINRHEVVSWQSPIVWSVLPNEKDVTKSISHLSNGQLNLLDYMVYYPLESDDIQTKRFKKTYKQNYLIFIEQTFKAMVPNEYKNYNPEDVWNVDVQIINAMGKQVLKQDPDNYNLLSKEELENTYKFDWSLFAKYLGYKKIPSHVVVSSLNGLKYCTELLKENWNTPAWNTWWLFIYYRQYIRCYPEWNPIYFNFALKFMRGQSVNLPPEIFPVYFLSFSFNNFLTQQYLEHNTNVIYQQYVNNMCEDLRKIFINRIKRNTWLSHKTKLKALLKLEKLEFVIGKPKAMFEDPLLDYTREDPWKNMIIGSDWKTNKVIEIEGASMIDFPHIDYNDLKLIGQQSYIVNAFYRSVSNSIYLPAAYIQKPFIDLDERGIEYNLAHIGFTIAHELSHCLDDSGSKYDENGNLNNWWTDRDREIYKRKIKDVVEQYEFVNARDGLEYDASIAIGENIADIVGLSLVEEYLFLFQEINKDTNNIKKISLEAFYTYVAIQSRQEVASKALSSQLKTNPHPLEKYRCNCPLSRLDIFRKIYNIQKGDGMWWRNTDTIW